MVALEKSIVVDDVISADENDRIARNLIVREISAWYPLSARQTFRTMFNTSWNGSKIVGKVCLASTGREIKLSLHLNAKKGIFLRGICGSDSFSMMNSCYEKGVVIVPIGENLPEHLWKDAGQKILALWWFVKTTARLPSNEREVEEMFSGLSPTSTGIE